MTTPGEVPTHFTDEANVGILTGAASGNLVDIDLDCDEAVRLAGGFLPPTPMWSGRSARPRSHAWFHVTGPLPPSQVFKDVDPDKTMLVELRADGRQTLVHPSVHPEGDVYRWEGPLEPAEVDGEDLARCVSRLAAATILARHWPREKGSRHDIANALAGMLVRAHWDADSTANFILAVAAAAGDEEARSRGAAARATAKRIGGDGRATGRPTLVTLLGPEVVGRVEEWLGLSELSAFIAFNAYATHAPEWPSAPAAEAMHGPVGRFIDVVGPHTESDPAAVLVQFLVAFGNCIGRTAYFEVEADRHYLNLFATIVGRTSKGRKGTSWGQVRRVFRAADSTWVEHCHAAGLSSGEGLIWRVRDEILKREPIKQKSVVVDYQDVVADPGVDDKRLLVIESEFSQVLKVICREGNTLSPTIRCAWDTGDLTTMVKNSPAKATSAHVSILGHITRDELVRQLDSTEAANGFANRFLWVCAKRSKCLPDGGSLTEFDLHGTIEDLTRAIAGARQTGRMCRDAEAAELWRAVYPDLSEGKPGLFGAVVSRAEAQVTRLSCIYALLDCSPVVRLVHLKAALALWNYVDASARFVFGSSLGDPVADTIQNALRANPTGLTRTDIRDLFKGNTPSSTIARALNSLVESGLAHFRSEDTGGRPAERWFASQGYAKNAINAERVPEETDRRAPDVCGGGGGDADEVAL